MPKSLPLVHGERVHLQQVLLNLVINALNSLSQKNGIARTLTIRARLKDDDEVGVAVEDNGLGISPDKLDNIFESFYATKADGMGFGLSISRTIVEAHGGHLTAENRAPHGAVFRIILPVEKAAGL